MWDKVNAITAIASLIVSVIALVVAILGTRSSTQISSEALGTARQANDIALGLFREPAIIEFAFSDQKRFIFDFTKVESLTGELEQTITVQNVGKKSIDAIALEFIGIRTLTYVAADPAQTVKEAPSISGKLELRSAIQPGGLAHIDVRKYLLLYLKKLEPQLVNKEVVYTSAVNVVLAPKAVNEPVPAGASSRLTTNDRRLITFNFVPTIIDSKEAKAVLEDPDVQHRVYD